MECNRAQMSKKKRVFMCMGVFTIWGISALVAVEGIVQRLLKCNGGLAWMLRGAKLT